MNDDHELSNQSEASDSTDPNPSPVRFFGFGLCMGTADAVPGVSGGTIALILGFYNQFIDSIAKVISILKSPFQADAWKAAIPAFKLLIPLVCGAITALYIATKLLVGKSASMDHIDPNDHDQIRQFILDNPPEGLLLHPQTAPFIFALFFGLVLFSIPQPWKCKSQTLPIDWVLATVGALVVATISLLNPASLGANPLFIIMAGALAISVMLLPGISGSLVLLIIGMYQPVSQAVHNREFDIISLFVLGIAIGVCSFVPLLRFILKRYHDRTMSCLTGLMFGSLLALWPWKTHYMPKLIESLGPMYPQLPNEVMNIIYVILCAAAGIALIFALQKIAGEK